MQFLKTASIYLLSIVLPDEFLYTPINYFIITPFFSSPLILEQERHQNEMYMLENDIKKWQDKYDMTQKDLQMRDSAIHRIELELDTARTDLERAKLQAEKSDSSKQLQENHMAQLQREIDNWKDKYNKAQDEVRIPKKKSELSLVCRIIFRV